MPAQILDRRRRFLRVVGSERGELSNVVRHAEMKDHRVGDRRPRYATKTARSLEAEIERDLIRGRTEGDVGELLVEVETLPTRQVETFVGDDRPMSLDESIFEATRVMVSMPAEILTLYDLRPEDQADRSGLVGSKVFRLRGPFVDPSIAFGDVSIEA